MPKVVEGRFVLLDRISGGASGSVWRAYDQRDGRFCAAKLVGYRDAETLLRVIREQGVRLTHPNVVSPNAWAADDDVVIAMDLVAGGSLTTLIRDHGALPSGYAARILAQLLAAHVHAAGLLHRDVKPDNVLMEATGTGPPHARLGDFGIAQPMGGPRLTETGYVMGTRAYLPPEAVAGAPPDVSRDLYAAGVVAWQMTHGAEEPPAGPVDGPGPHGVSPALWATGAAVARSGPRGPAPGRGVGGPPAGVRDRRRSGPTAGPHRRGRSDRCLRRPRSAARRVAAGAATAAAGAALRSALRPFSSAAHAFGWRVLVMPGDGWPLSPLAAAVGRYSSNAA